MSILLRVLICLLVSLPGVVRADFEGEVFSVSDGDTVQVIRHGQPVRVQIKAIKAPGWNSSYAREAREALEDLVDGEDVVVKTDDTGLFGRVYGEVFLKGGGNVAHMLVKQGLARWDQKADPDNTTLARLEQEAREARLGIWEEEDAATDSDFARNNERNTGGLQVVKKDSTGRCVVPGSPDYEDLEDYTGYTNLRLCMESGGTPAWPGFPFGRIEFAK